MYRVVVVEDEAEEAERLSALLRRYAEVHGEEFQITWHASAMELLSDKSRYDLCFLDIDMPGINGMEAAGLLRVCDETIPIIFVTNLAKYAVRGYEVGATGFIVKPATYGSLSMNLDRALRTLRQTAHRTIMIPTDDGMRVVGVSSLAYVEVTGHRLTYHLEDEQPLEARGTLAALEEDLRDAPMVRVSKSCLANMDKISLLRGSDLTMVTGDVLRISRARKREVTEAVTDYLGGRR